MSFESCKSGVFAVLQQIASSLTAYVYHFGTNSTCSYIVYDTHMQFHHLQVECIYTIGVCTDKWIDAEQVTIEDPSHQQSLFVSLSNFSKFLYYFVTSTVNKQVSSGFCYLWIIGNDNIQQIPNNIVTVPSLYSMWCGLPFFFENPTDTPPIPLPVQQPYYYSLSLNLVFDL